MKTNLKVILGLSLLSFTASGVMAFEDEKSGAETSFNAITGKVDLAGIDAAIPVVKTNSIVDSVLNYIDPDRLNKRTKFETLKAMFNAGRKPATDEVTGWFSGRLFTEVAPNRAKGTLLIGHGKTITEKEASLSFSFAWHPDKSDCFDYLKSSIPDNMSDYRNAPNLLAEFTKNEIVFFGSPYSQKNYYQLRKYNDYLVIKRTSKNTEFDFSWVSYGYYFKEVTPVVVRSGS